MDHQETFDDYLARKPVFHGAGVDMVRDASRLTGQLKRVYDAMSDGQWRTIPEIAAATKAPENAFRGDPENSVSAQFRNLKKVAFGGYTVERERRDNLNYYRLTVAPKGNQA